MYLEERIKESIAGHFIDARKERKQKLGDCDQKQLEKAERLSLHYLQKALESFWSAKSTAVDLHYIAAELRMRNWSAMKQAGIDHIPVGDFSLYDHMLDMAVAVGAVPERYQGVQDPLVRYFAMARGLQDREAGIDVPALEMTKWFDTNYHYIVPELDPDKRFALNASKLLSEIDEARRVLGIDPRPVIPGPVTFLLLSKMAGGEKGTATLDLLDNLLPVYKQLLTGLAKRRVGWVQLDEPCLTLELDDCARSAYRLALARLTTLEDRPRLMLTTYFGALQDNLAIAVGSGTEFTTQEIKV